jgi:hypothetical protein
MIAQGANAVDLGPRVAWFLKGVYLGDSALKRIARDYNVSVGTAKLWWNGKCPTSEHLTAMAKRWGWRFVTFVFEGPIGTPAMFAEMQASEERIARRVAERLAYEAQVMEVARSGRANGGGDSDVGGPDATAPVSRPERAA